MKRTTLNQTGFEAVGIIVALLFVAIIGFAGYKVLNMNKSAASQDSSAISSQQVAVPAKLKTKADLSQTGKALDKSSSQLDTSLNDKSLDADLSTME